MLNFLNILHQRIKDNKKSKDGPCRNYPLVNDCDGPVLIEHAGEFNPKAIIISESPAGFESIDYNFSKLGEWKQKTLSSIRNFKQWKKIGQLNSLGKFLAGLTDNKMVDPEDPITINEIYWTHALKCFIQKNESLKSAKKQLGNKFDRACKCCVEYLREEIEIVKPKLIVLVGDKAFNAVFPEKKDIIGKAIKFPDAELIYTYHPNAKVRSEYKKKGFNYARRKIENYL
ncbi:MAG: uracil-DNA glycosylase family protein [candidate division Zixibacteria bacterium]|nr:uracil-DNA glycosylase family protein [candidate division Zixibacteria bacterium]